jgi:hypothetical protein
MGDWRHYPARHGGNADDLMRTAANQYTISSDWAPLLHLLLQP